MRHSEGLDQRNGELTQNAAMRSIHVKEDTPGIWMPAHGYGETAYVEQSELLIPPEATMRILEVKEHRLGIPQLEVEISW